jgi:hypothetical protein
LERELQNLTAAGQLAGTVADRSAEGSYRQTLGLMTQIREDFEIMSKLLMRDSSEYELDNIDAAGDSLPKVDRIVLYIDDLDRCPPARVVQVLEAVHLMLAIPLFVVVVAVDPRWLVRAIAAHYSDILYEDDQARFGDRWASTPVQYLDKIFQVILNLPRLTTNGYSALIDDLVVRRATGTATTVSHTKAESAVASEGGGTPLSNVERGDTLSEMGLPLPQLVELVDPLALTGEELVLLRLLGPPLITTPRSVKRLVNSYALLVTMRRLSGQPTTGEAIRPALVLLAVLIGFPELGGPFLTWLYRYSRQDSTAEWRQFVTALAASGAEPRDRSGTPAGTAEMTTSWHQLSEWLTSLADAADGDGVPLPARINDWATWVPDVSRLAFPAGSIVGALNREL